MVSSFTCPNVRLRPNGAPFFSLTGTTGVMISDFSTPLPKIGTDVRMICSMISQEKKQQQPSSAELGAIDRGGTKTAKC